MGLEQLQRDLEIYERERRKGYKLARDSDSLVKTTKAKIQDEEERLADQAAAEEAAEADQEPE